MNIHGFSLKKTKRKQRSDIRVFWFGGVDTTTVSFASRGPYANLFCNVSGWNQNNQFEHMRVLLYSLIIYVHFWNVILDILQQYSILQCMLVVLKYSRTCLITHQITSYSSWAGKFCLHHNHCLHKSAKVLGGVYECNPLGPNLFLDRLITSGIVVS